MGSGRRAEIDQMADQHVHVSLVCVRVAVDAIPCDFVLKGRGMRSLVILKGKGDATPCEIKRAGGCDPL